MARALGNKYMDAVEQPCLKRTVAMKLMCSEFAADAYMLRRFHTEAIVGSAALDGHDLKGSSCVPT